jgi:competence protein ComEA
MSPKPQIGAREFQHRMLTGPALAILLLAAGACNKSPSQVRQDTQNATQQTKQEAKGAAENTRAVLGVAVKDVDAATDGLKAGIKSKTSANSSAAKSDSASDSSTADDRVDLNSASKMRLIMLPGIGPSQADAIIANRPYRTARQTVTSGALSQHEFDEISAKVTVR